MNCPHCGYDVADNNSYCYECGNQVDIEIVQNRTNKAFVLINAITSIKTKGPVIKIASMFVCFLIFSVIMPYIYVSSGSYEQIHSIYFEIVGFSIGSLIFFPFVFKNNTAIHGYCLMMFLISIVVSGSGLYFINKFHENTISANTSVASNKSQDTDNNTSYETSASEGNTKDEMNVAINTVKSHQIPEGLTVVEKIHNTDNMNYGVGEWIAYRAGEKTECPRTDDPDIAQYADWIVCYKTIFKTNGAEFPKNPTWIVKDGNAYPQNGTAASLTNENIAAKEGYAQPSQGTYSNEDQAPTAFECNVFNENNQLFEEYSKQDPSGTRYEELNNKARRSIASKYGISVDKVKQIEDKVLYYNNGTNPRACN